MAYFYAITLSLVIVASPLFAQQATPTQMDRMVEVARDTCLATFPTYGGIDKHLAAKGLAKDSLGVWRGPVTFILMRQSSSGIPDCEVWMTYGSRTQDVSDALERALPRLGVGVERASRRGVRLSVAFRKDGAKGTLETEQARGRTSRIVVRAEGSS